MGFALRAPNNEYVMDISFGSQGFLPALARVFSHVRALLCYSGRCSINYHRSMTYLLSAQ